MPSVVSTSPVSFSSKILGIATVVALKMMPPHSVVTSSMENTRASSAREKTCLGPPVAAFAASLTSGTAEANPMPIAIETIPGKMKAARQLTQYASAPAISAAKATPKLPKTPLTPSTRPTFSRPLTSIAMPTG